ncbi:MAG TPA: guanylate kinase [Limnochordia bacterium]|nr:guanylate kinase [Limnochordia bacterium]
MLQTRGFLIVVSGPGGVGKNTLINAVLPRMPELLYSVSATTRPPRPGEVEGKDYFFRTPEQFQAMIEGGELLEWAEFCGHRYGTPRAFVDQALAAGRSVITDIDIQGAAQIRRNMPEGVFVFLIPPTIEELRRRLEQRGADSQARVAQRLDAAAVELQAIGEYDYFVVNDDIAQGADRLMAIIAAERCRIDRSDYRTLLNDFSTHFHKGVT